MTGAFIRVNRGGKWQAVQFDELTVEEIEKRSQEFPEEGWKWAKFLALWIQTNVKSEDNT